MARDRVSGVRGSALLGGLAKRGRSVTIPKATATPPRATRTATGSSQEVGPRVARHLTPSPPHYVSLESCCPNRQQWNEGFCRGRARKTAPALPFARSLSQSALPPGAGAQADEDARRTPRARTTRRRTRKLARSWQQPRRHHPATSGGNAPSGPPRAATRGRLALSRHIRSMRFRAESAGFWLWEAVCVRVGAGRRAHIL